MDSPIDTPPVLVEMTLTCASEGCENAGIPIVMLCTDAVVCGSCGLSITDVDPAQ